MVWQIDKTTKHCKECDILINDNTEYFSALFYHLQSEPKPDAQVKEGSQRLVRYDFCSNCWERRTASGEEKPFSFWQTKIEPPAEPPKTPRQVLLNFFDNLFNDLTKNPDSNVALPETAGLNIQSSDIRLKSQVKYLFGLILLRKKLLRIKGSTHKDNVPYLVFERVSDNKIYEIAEINISDDELVALREEFSKLFEFRI